MAMQALHQGGREESPMIGIVGAGISGLALGMELRERGIPYRIFERRRTPGGVIRTVNMRGLRLELGPQRVRATPEIQRRFRSLLESVPEDLEQILPKGESPPILVARGNRLYPLPETVGEGIRTRALSLRGKARAALWPLMALRPPSGAGVSAGAYLRHLAGEEAYRTFLGPLFGGLYGSDPDRMDAHRSLVPALTTLGGGGPLSLLSMGNGRDTGLGRYPPLVLPHGMVSLVQDLHTRQSGFVHLETPVAGLRRMEDGGVEIRAGSERHPFQAVVLTTPPEPAAHLLDTLDPNAARRLRRLHLNRLVLVHLEADRLPPGLGFQVAFGEDRRIRGVTFSGHLDGSGRTAVAYMGGMWDPQAHQLPDPELGRVAAAEFTAITGSEAKPLHVHRVAMPAWDASWRALDGMTLPSRVHLLTNYTGRPGIPGRLQEAARLADELAARRPE
jgi:protoporphyrinogen/coproporphyrinogen III oxidase